MVLKQISVEMGLRLIFGFISELFLIIQHQLQMLLAISMHLVNNAARLLKLLSLLVYIAYCFDVLIQSLNQSLVFIVKK